MKEYEANERIIICESKQDTLMTPRTQWLNNTTCNTLIGHGVHIRIGHSDGKIGNSNGIIGYYNDKIQHYNYSIRHIDDTLG